jgi:hypothetical protein
LVELVDRCTAERLDLKIRVDNGVHDAPTVVILHGKVVSDLVG